jgi:heme oxygenase
VEAAVDVLRPGLTRAEYRHLLERFWGFHAAVEPRLYGAGVWEQLSLEGDERRKLPLLARDLQRLGLSADALARLPLCTDLPGLRCVPAALGCAYVLEGATLGGAIIARHLARTLGLAPERGGAFFGGYGACTGPRWKAFTDALHAYSERNGAEECIVRGACEIFEALERWLQTSP